MATEQDDSARRTDATGTADGQAGFDSRQVEEIETRASVRPPIVFEAIRRQGREEMRRPTTALALSGVAAGIALGFSVLAEAALAARLPEGPWTTLVSSFGYTLGFLIVILGQMQLFTETTITPVCEMLERPTRRVFGGLLRIWTVVLAANLVGTALFAAAALHTAAATPAVVAEMLEISRHAMEPGFWQVVAGGVPAGWLIAALVWLSPTAGAARALTIVVITYVIAVADMTHVVAGSAEAALLVMHGEATLRDAYLGFVAPAVIGNVIGGSALFTLLVWGQIQGELPPVEARDADARAVGR